MIKIILSGITVCAPFLTLCADGAPDCEIPKEAYAKFQPSAPIKPIHEHRINFGFLNLGYERIQPDSIYTGFEAKVSSIWHSKDSHNYSLDHYVNGELRLGYNHTLSKKDTVTGYGGVGFSMFSVEKQAGKLKNWSYGTIGAKYMHQFGEMFEMGVHLKGYLSISQRRYEETTMTTQIPTITILHQVPTDGTLPDASSPVVTSEFQNNKEIVIKNTKTISVHDTRWLTEIGMPMVWHVGAQKNWEIQLEPYYLQIPNIKTTHVLGSRLSFGYRY